jgi:hypothetical protein
MYFWTAIVAAILASSRPPSPQDHLANSWQEQRIPGYQDIRTRISESQDSRQQDDMIATDTRIAG